MCTIHIFENGINVGYSNGRINAGYGTEEKTSIPIESIEGINVYGKPLITTQCIEECMKRAIPISFFTSAGGYIGGFVGSYMNVKRQRMQAVFNTTDTSFFLAKKIIRAKISNQLTVLRRYSKDKEIDNHENISSIKQYCNSLNKCDSIPQLMGYEGVSARNYFEGMGKLVKDEFAFSKRTKHPPKNRFNALLSYGYSLLFKELYGIISSKGLNPYFGFIHENKENHPALVSDMMEEWRAVIVDSMIMRVINGNEITVDDFESNDTYILNNSGRKKIIEKYNNKMETVTSYISGQTGMTYRRALEYQVRSLIRVIEDGDVELYNPISIR